MKMIIGIILAGFLSAPAMGAVAQKAQKAAPNNWVPFPWATELPFTWSTAQGVWTVNTGGKSAGSYFYIRVTKDRNDSNIKFLSITEREADTCNIVATGFGTEENNKRIVAQMKTVESRMRYRMMLRLFDPASVPQNQHVNPFKGKVMVLTVMPLGSFNQYNYPMSKLSDRTEYPCKPVK